MNQVQLKRMREDKGFIAALDQSGGSTPKALEQYGIPKNSYSGEAEMYALAHAMRCRIMTSPAFSGEWVLGAILFENTMNRETAGLPTPDYLWQKKRIIPFLKVDKGLADLDHGVQLMRPMPNLAGLLEQAREKNIFGTKMRSLIKEANAQGIADNVAQQFAVGRQIAAAGLVPILEPEVDINSPDRAECERLLKQELIKNLESWRDETKIMFKLTIPVRDNFYAELINDSRVLRVVALSGGFSRAEANEKLARNHGLVASFSRALAEGLNVNQNEAEFDAALAASVNSIYAASIT